MAKVKRKVKTKKSISGVSPFVSYWTNNNYILLFVGLGVLILGFVLMSIGPWDNPISMHISPIVLLVAYLIIFPAAILYNKKKEEGSADDSSES